MSIRAIADSLASRQLQTTHGLAAALHLEHLPVELCAMTNQDQSWGHFDGSPAQVVSFRVLTARTEAKVRDMTKAASTANAPSPPPFIPNSGQDFRLEFSERRGCRGS